MRCYDFPSRLFGRLFGSLPGSTLPSSVRVWQLVLALAEGRRGPSGQRPFGRRPDCGAPMQKFECPHCHKRTISVLTKLFLGSFSTTRCQSCWGRTASLHVSFAPSDLLADLKNAGAALFDPDLDHLSLEAILVLASGKFSRNRRTGPGCRCHQAAAYRRSRCEGG